MLLFGNLGIRDLQIFCVELIAFLNFVNKIH